MLRGDDHHDVDQIFKHVIPKVFGNPMYSPIFFPLYLDAKQGGSRHGNIDALPRKAQDLLAGTTKLVPYGSYREYVGLPFSQLLELHPEQAAWAGLACSFGSPEDIEALRQFLLVTFDDDTRVVDTSEYKLACKYDELVYSAKLRALVSSPPGGSGK